MDSIILVDDINRSKHEYPNPRSKVDTPTLFHLELTSQETDLYLILRPLYTTSLKGCKEQVEMRSKDLYTIIDISCQSAEAVIISLGHVSHALDVKKYM
ncbi:hypothetical protein HMPREF1544_06436 [Mucor circinelloides 1006PhL]|uniref:Uncharacterized protein n=1 Tax=Mucor circinelloides f. circinelloides (strain 1006PhL) TaxID=1220926 RepID=S2JVC0_MUCC1|nr:hypothetical protein HMPREF1544_06436 [Mucor circinelloides 1006PhL]